MENHKMKILAFILSYLLTASTALAVENQSIDSRDTYSKETQILLKMLEDKIVTTVREITYLQSQDNGNINDHHFDLSIAKKLDTNMGLVLDFVPQQKGYKVLSVSPGSPSDRIGIKPQDVILKINDIVANNKNRTLILENVRAPTPDKNITFQIKRNSALIAFSSVAKANLAPSFELDVGAYLLAEIYNKNKALSNEETCGFISVSSRPKKSLKLYPTSIIKINGERMKQKNYYIGASMSRQRIYPKTYRLSPGRYEIDLLIPGRKSYKTTSFEIDIKANIQYHLAVDFIPENKKTGVNSQWKAVVWHEKKGACEFRTAKK